MRTKGLYVNVFKDSKGVDCTANGISAKNDRLILIGDGVDCEVFDGDETNTVKIVKRQFHDGEYIHVEPIAERPANSVGPMFGGNFIYSSDSRFRAVSKQPIPIHDRYEIQR